MTSRYPSLELQAPVRHTSRMTLIVKQGANGYPVYRRAHMGYLHVDFKVRTNKQANRKIQSLLQLCSVGQLTTWWYGTIYWILQKCYQTSEATHPVKPQFRIFKGLPPNLPPHEQQLVMAALLHDLVDTERYPSKLGRAISIPNPYVRWLCEHHHTLKESQTNPDLQRLQSADVRTARYARLLHHPTRRRKMLPVDASQLARQLEHAAQHSVYQRYSVIYHSDALNNITASKAHPTETLRNHLLGVANWVLYLGRMQTSSSRATAVALVGESGGTPGPVEMEDPWDKYEP